MKVTQISRGGQVQVPAEVRRRWGSRRVMIDDLGGSLTIRPLPDDPIGAALGSLRGPGPTSDQMRQQAREEEAEADAREHR